MAAEKNPPSPVVPSDVEEALFQRLLRRMQESVSSAGSSVASGASQIGQAGSEAAAAVAQAVLDAGTFVKENPAALAPLALVPGMAPLTVAAVSAMAAKQIIEARKRGEADTAQVLFRVPEALRARLKGLAADQGKQLDALLIEACVDVLAKYDRVRVLPGPDAP